MFTTATNTGGIVNAEALSRAPLSSPSTACPLWRIQSVQTDLTPATSTQRPQKRKPKPNARPNTKSRWRSKRKRLNPPSLWKRLRLCPQEIKRARINAWTTANTKQRRQNIITARPSSLSFTFLMILRYTTKWRIQRKKNIWYLHSHFLRDSPTFRYN